MTEPAPADGPAEAEVFTAFVGQLAYNVTQRELLEYLSPCGEITRLFMPAGESAGNNRGFAFVDFKHADGVKRALQLSEEEVMLKGRVPLVRDDSDGRPGSKDKDAQAAAQQKPALRIKKVTETPRWETLCLWEDIDMDTVSSRPTTTLFQNYDVGLQLAPSTPQQTLSIKVVGGAPVDPIDSFDEAQLHKVILQNVALCGFKAPTPIQRHSIPLIASKQDLIACSQTGSGKTAAFALPLIARLLKTGPRAPTDRSTVFPSLLVLAPTRELAKQIETDCRKLAYNTFIKVAACYGGVSYEEEEENLTGSHVIVATPGRLIDSVKRKNVSLGYVTAVVVDEADRMLDMGFEPDLRQIFLQEDLPDRSVRQSLMFSATFPSHVQKIARAFLRSDHAHVTVGTIGMANLNIDQRFVHCKSGNKYAQLIELLDSTVDGMALVFVGRKNHVAYLERFLSEHEFSVTSLHGDKKQNERDHALSEFRSGRKTVLVATDVASRGLDIQNITHVINFDLPSNIDDYVHRIGRTARAGKSGRATSLFGDDDIAIARPLANFLEQQGLPVPDWLVNAAKDRVIRDENFAAWDRLVFEQAKGQKRVYASVTTVGGSFRRDADDDF